jgi:hypothetical protein
MYFRASHNCVQQRHSNQMYMLVVKDLKGLKSVC